jgi:hypothetical protein
MFVASVSSYRIIDSDPVFCWKLSPQRIVIRQAGLSLLAFGYWIGFINYIGKKQQSKAGRK